MHEPHYSLLLQVFVYIRLLDLLADRKDKSGKSGKVLINGAKRQSNYKSVVGYVVQVSSSYSLTLRLPLVIFRECYLSQCIHRHNKTIYF